MTAAQHCLLYCSDTKFASVQVMRDSWHSCMQQEGQGLVHAIALALVQSCPRSLLRALSVPLRALLTDPVLGNTAKTLAHQIMSSAQYSGPDT